MPFANIKLPEAALNKQQKAELVHAITELFVGYFSERARPFTMVLIEEVKDGGYSRADEVMILSQEHRAKPD
jgi:4-oxalocrotonate tautomerase